MKPCQTSKRMKPALLNCPPPLRMTNLKMVTASLTSSKVKERQEGIAYLKETFARDDAVLKIKDERGWLVLYQALFTAVANEKAECDKKAASGKSATTGAT